MKFSVTLLYIAIALVPFCAKFAQAGQPMFKPDEPRAGWRGFGTGFDDASANIKNSEIKVYTNWERATWGVGLMYVFDKPVDGRKIRSIRVKVRTENNSKTKLYAGMAVKDDASVGIKRKKALTLNGQWQVFDFPVSQMAYEKPDLNTRMFTDDDWDNITTIKFLFTKPSIFETASEIILIRNPELMLKSE